MAICGLVNDVASTCPCHVLGRHAHQERGFFTLTALFGNISVFAKIHYNPIVVGDAVNNEGSKNMILNQFNKIIQVDFKSFLQLI